MALSKSNAREVETGRRFLRLGNPGAYARSISGLYRASTRPQQAALAEVIREDDTGPLFTRFNGTIVAKAL